MLIYYFLISFMGLCSIFTLNMRNKYKRNRVIVFISCSLIVVIQSLRKITVGVDLTGYISGLEIAKYMNFFKGDKLFNYEFGYSIYSQFFARLNISDQQYLFIVAITILIPIAYIWTKNSKMPGISILLYITLGFFTFSFSGLRQSISIGITFFSFKYIQKKNIFKFLICTSLAISFHTSAIIFVIAYPLYYLKFKKEHFYFIIPGLIISFIFKSRIFLLLYSLYRGEEGQIETTNAYTMLFIMIFILILAYIFGSNNKNRLDFNAYKNYMLVAIFIQIFASQSNIVMRIGYYYYIFITLLIPEVINSQKDTKLKIIATGIIIISLLYFFQKTTGNGYLDVSPYYFYWE